MNKKIIFQKCTFNNIYFLLYIIVYTIMQILNKSIDIKDYLEENPDKYDENYFMVSAQLLIAFSAIIADFFQ